jgi:hypothetical protein
MTIPIPTPRPKTRKRGKASKGRRVFHKLARWVIFGILAALIPFAFTWWHLWSRPSGKPVTVGELWSRGELLLVATVIGMEAVGELFGSGPEWLSLKLIGGGACFILAILSAGFFGDVQAMPGTNSAKICTASIWIFVGTIVSGMACKVLVEVSE